ncbi:hypothetical protein C1645_780688, partial [Glomus cerebriforme]
MPTSKKLSNILWEELSINYREFFTDLASKVVIEHGQVYPDYKYEPKKRCRKGTIVICDPQKKERSLTSVKKMFPNEQMGTVFKM